MKLCFSLIIASLFVHYVVCDAADAADDATLDHWIDAYTRTFYYKAYRIEAATNYGLGTAQIAPGKLPHHRARCQECYLGFCRLSKDQ